MIGQDFHLDQVLPPALHLLGQDGFQSFIYWRRQDLPPVFGTESRRDSDRQKRQCCGYVCSDIQTVEYSRYVPVNYALVASGDVAFHPHASHDRGFTSQVY